MAIYCIGDIHGCNQELQLLLQKIDYNPSTDTLYILGDLVNRGGYSIDVLRYLMRLEGSAHCILGNHDIHTLAVAAGVRAMHPQDTISDILNAPDSHILVDWLRRQPLALYAHRCLMVHAGVQASWDIARTIACAAEISQLLRSVHWQKHIQAIFGNQPTIWSDDLSDMPRWRCSLNTLSRIRMVEAATGAMNFAHKGAPSDNDGDLVPWYNLPQRRTADTQIFFGHWATLGLLQQPNIIGLDSGCVWGGALTAAEITATGDMVQLVQVPSKTSAMISQKP